MYWNQLVMFNAADLVTCYADKYAIPFTCYWTWCLPYQSFIRLCMTLVPPEFFEFIMEIISIATSASPAENLQVRLGRKTRESVSLGHVSIFL